MNNIGTFFITFFIIFFSNLSTGQTYDKEKNDITFKILKSCNDSLAPPGSFKRENSGQFDIVKQICLCYADKAVENYYPDFSKFSMNKSLEVMKTCTEVTSKKFK
ncbi:hypothetical protein [Comamonas odontotermitis]|uniref:hypothetical protein n=1 Tax=Comamonas odontotermitis TaxID=379895 RepID=UPI001CC6219D|nr:hypothetical protein [Comamonas odontotermitis]UBB18551.1 hypothetical protein LAD35_07920 [Comamonas odontotermitis]